MNIEDYQLYKGAWVFKKAPHLSEKLSKREAKLLLNRGGILIRNTYDFDCKYETSFWYVIKDTFSGFDELSSKVKNQIRKSLKTYTIRKITKDEMLNLGYPIFCEAIKGYKVPAKPITVDTFINRISNESKRGNVDYWMAFEKETNKAVALSINTIVNDSCQYSTMKAIPFYLKNSTYPYYGLIYEMNRYYLDEMKLKYVCDGARTITEHSNIQSFLIKKFNFRKAYCQLQIEYNWWMKIFVSLLYNFRTIIPIRQVKAILNMEAMKRNKY